MSFIHHCGLLYTSAFGNSRYVILSILLLYSHPDVVYFRCDHDWATLAIWICMFLDLVVCLVLFFESAIAPVCMVPSSGKVPGLLLRASHGACDRKWSFGLFEIMGLVQLSSGIVFEGEKDTQKFNHSNGGSQGHSHMHFPCGQTSDVASACQRKLIRVILLDPELSPVYTWWMRCTMGILFSTLVFHLPPLEVPSVPCPLCFFKQYIV